MKTILICPGHRPDAALFAETAPLANVSFFGQPLVIHWIEHLVKLGATDFRLLASDRPQEIRRLVGDGARWGVQIEVVPAQRELSVTEARQAHVRSEEKWLPAPADVVVLDTLPNDAAHLWSGAPALFAALRAALPCAARREQRLGLREIQPGVWAGLRTQISPTAELRAPCWISDKVFVGPHAIIGPGAVLESEVVVEEGAEITESYVGSQTFVGPLTKLNDSCAIGATLINWRTGSHTRVPDEFLLCSLARHAVETRPTPWLGRAAALSALVLTSPVLLYYGARAQISGQSVFRRRRAVAPSPRGLRRDIVLYFELAQARGVMRRWPQLWSIARGNFSWVGNRPLNRSEAAKLTNDFELLWLEAPLGLISQADAEGCPNFSDEGRAHASFYAVQSGWRLDTRIIRKALLRWVKSIGQPAIDEPEFFPARPLNLQIGITR
jgi:NDP-sugar pyrophosphorylase family protein